MFFALDFFWAASGPPIPGARFSVKSQLPAIREAVAEQGLARLWPLGRMTRWESVGLGGGGGAFFSTGSDGERSNYVGDSVAGLLFFLRGGGGGGILFFFFFFFFWGGVVLKIRGTEYVVGRILQV